MLSIRDSGCGMDPDALANMFEPFFTTKAKGRGTGLGLATVYGIIKQNGGSVGVESSIGEGTTVRIYLPSFERATDTMEGTAGAGVLSGGDETLLLVEDEESVRVTTRMFLEQLGYAVLAAETPSKALETVRESGDQIDALITDVVMPGMNGRELAEELKSGNPGLRVLYISGYTDDVIACRGILEEGVELVPKPIDRDVLARRIRSILDG